ncbi:MAG: hypothetical protein WDN09_04110 [bacterium]
MKQIFNGLENAEKYLSNAQNEIEKIQELISDKDGELRKLFETITTKRNDLLKVLNDKKGTFLKSLIDFGILVGIKHCSYSINDFGQTVLFISKDKFRIKNNPSPEFGSSELMQYIRYNPFCERMTVLIQEYIDQYPKDILDCSQKRKELDLLAEQLNSIFESVRSIKC